MTKTFIMNRLNKFFFLLLLLSGITYTSCVDNDFDEPENTFMVDQNDVITVADVTSILDTTSSLLLTDADLGGERIYLKVAVTADDASGNLFKLVTFEDESGALSIIPDRNELNAEFPTGSVIYIKLNGLTIANSNGTPQLGYGLDGDDFLQRIPDLLVGDFMFVTNEKSVIIPTLVTIKEFKDNESLYLNRLVTFENVEFTGEFAGQTYAITNADTGETPETVNAIINDCDNNTLIVRNSGFSDFAGDIIPMFNGSVTGIVSKFGQDLQLFLRDKNDVMLTSPRCLDNLGEESILPISELVALSSSNFLLLDENSTGKEQAYIKAFVVADDESGTFFKTLIVEDETGGIKLSLDGFDLFQDYPVGSEVLVSLNGLTLQSDAENPSIGDGEEDDRLQRIAEGKIGSVITRTGMSKTLVPLDATIDEIVNGGSIMLNRLVRLPRVELDESQVGNAFAADANQNLNLSDCEDDNLIFRSSSFASFAEDILPTGSGSFVGISGKFLSDVQVFLRSRSDMNFDMERCDGSGGFPDNELTIASIQDRFYQFSVDESENGFITGTVISDKANVSFPVQNIVVQNGDRGIVVRFQNTHNFNLGTTVKINVSGQELSEFNGLLQINNVPNGFAISTGSAPLPDGNELTISDLQSDINRYESTRVLIKEADFTSGSTFADSPDISDGTGSIQLFTKFSAAFANLALPNGPFDVTAIVGEFNNPQLIINDPSDISGGTVDPGGNGGEGAVDQTFEGFGDFDPVQLTGWLNIATKGDRQWYTRTFDNNGFVECEAFNDNNPATEAWLVTPTIDTDVKSMFSFDSAIAFWQHQGLSVWVSQDFTDLSSADWIELTEAKLASNSNANYVFVASGDIDLKDYLGGKVRVGFKYEGTSSSNTTKVRLDNVMLK